MGQINVLVCVITTKNSNYHPKLWFCLLKPWFLVKSLILCQYFNIHYRGVLFESYQSVATLCWAVRPVRHFKFQAVPIIKWLILNYICNCLRFVKQSFIEDNFFWQNNNGTYQIMCQNLCIHVIHNNVFMRYLRQPDIFDTLKLD